jgi:hypothetical protein
MTLYLQTQSHCLERNGQAFQLRNLASGELKEIRGVDAFLLELDLRTCPAGQLDSMLERYEVTL